MTRIDDIILRLKESTQIVHKVEINKVFSLQLHVQYLARTCPSLLNLMCPSHSCSSITKDGSVSMVWQNLSQSLQRQSTSISSATMTNHNYSHILARHLPMRSSNYSSMVASILSRKLLENCTSSQCGGGQKMIRTWVIAACQALHLWSPATQCRDCGN